MAEISIIIPVYNGEKYIARALDSLLNQVDIDTRLFEIICLNDGSTDSSMKVLNTYHKRCPEIIKVVDQKNIGVALTRNKGIKIATSEYITFLDQDDFYELDAFSAMFEYINEGNYDVVQCGYRRTDTKNKKIFEVKLKNTEYSAYMMSAAWGKLHRRSFLLENNIEFFDNKYGEDIIFTINEIILTEKLKIIPNYVAYNWFFNEQSVSNTIQIGFKDDDGFDKLLEKLLEVEVSKKQRAMYEYYILRTIFYYLLKSGRGVEKNAFVLKERELLYKVKKYYPDILNNKYIFFGPSGELFSMKCIIMCMVAAHKLKLVSLVAYLYCKK